MLQHTLSMMFTSKSVCFISLDSSCHGSNSFLDICINNFVNLGYICYELLDILMLWCNA
jgi:hypothetical protein